ncbi:MAG: nucleotidyltransferase domain-containing protein [Chlamydiae bacterium]|nr:nucleotidyltransferase domain-containing protein [Chlamydiota bacterium]
MMMFGLIEKDIEKIRKVFEQFPKIESVIIFGSRAMGHARKGSDIDLALIGKVDDDTLRQVHTILENEISLPYQFDIVAYDKIANPELKKHIIEWGQDFYRRNI